MLRVFVGDAKENAVGERDFAKMGVESEDARGDARSRWVKLNQLNRLVALGELVTISTTKETCVVGVYHPVLGQEERKRERRE